MGEPVLEIPFFGGIDESTRDELVDAARSFRIRENVRQTTKGGADKRWGFAAQALTKLDATSRSSGSRLLPLGNVVGVIGSDVLDTYSTTAAVNVAHGRVPEASYSTMYVPSQTATTSNVLDLAYCGGYIAVLQFENLVMWVTLLDVAGNVIRGPDAVHTVGLAESFGALATYSTYLVLTIADGNSANMPAYYLDTTSAATITTGWTAVSGTNVATDKTTSNAGAYALSVQSLTNRIAFAYVNNSGGASQLTVKTFTVAGVSETATVNTSSAKPTCVAVEGSIADTLWVAWDESTTVKIKGLDADSLSTALATTASLITLSSAAPPAIGVVSSSTAGKGRIVCTDGAEDRLHMRGFQTSGGAAATDGSQCTVPCTMLGSRPFRQGSRYYALFSTAPGESLNSIKRAILCDFTADQTWIRPVANIEPGASNFGSLRRAHIESLGSSRYATCLSIDRTQNSRAAAVVTLDFADIERWQYANHNGEHILGGGLVSTFDGVRVAELGFVVKPPKPSAVDAGYGSGPNGTYRYVVTYEEVDARGNWTISEVSDPSDAVTVTDNTIMVTFRPLGITAKQLEGSGYQVRIRIWRTKAGGEAPYYLVATYRNATDAIAAFSTHADSTADASLSSSQLLRGDGNLPETNGSALDRWAPPGLKHLTSYNNMLVGARGSVLWHSVTPVVGEATWFSPVFQAPFPSDIVTLASQDGTLYVFTESDIFAVGGEEPSENGQSGGLGLPRRLAVDRGAAQSPTCVTSQGIFFVSVRGIEILSRAQSVEFVGERVQTTFAAYPVVTAITYDPHGDVVLVECAASTSGGQVSGNGRTLVYDLRSKSWDSIDRRKNQAGTADSPAQDGGMVWNGSAWRYAWLGTDGRVYVEDHTTYLDPGSAWVTKKIQTGRVHIAGIQGEQAIDRVLTMGEYHTAHDLTLAVTHDYATSSSESQTWSATQLAAISPMSLDRGLTRITGQAVQITLTDATPSSGSVGTGRGGTWVALTFSGAPHRGPKRTTSAQRGG